MRGRIINREKCKMTDLADVSDYPLKNEILNGAPH